MRRAVVVGGGLVAVAALSAALLVGCGDDGPGSLVGGGKGGSALGVVKVEPADRLEPPTVAGETLEGEQLDVADLRGDVVVLNIWGSWCAPCRAESPDLERTAQAFEPDGVRFVGIDTKDSREKALAFVRNIGMTYPSVYDPDGKVQQGLRDHVPPTSVPSTIVLDREGRVAVTVVGPVTEDSLTEVLRPVVDEQARVAGRTLAGDRVDTADLRGEVVAVQVWGSWNAPSRDALPDLNRAVAVSGVDATVVGVATKDTRAAARALAQRVGAGEDSVLDADGSVVEALSRAAFARGLTLRADAVPAVVVLDRTGAVSAVLDGPVDDAAVAAALRTAAGEA